MSAFFILSVAIHASAYARTDKKPTIEHPDARVMAEQKEILARVVKLGGNDATCSGTWYDDGIIFTANHCLKLIEDGSKLSINGKTTTAQKVIYITKNIFHVQNGEFVEMKKSYEHDDIRENPADVAVMLVDRKPLQELKELPKNSISMVDAQSGNVAAGTELLVAGYGRNSMLYQTTGFGAAIAKTVEPKGTEYSLAYHTNYTQYYSVFCVPGYFAPQCRRVSVLKKHLNESGKLDPTILSGDSGGPAFRKNSKGEWQLLGIQSMTKTTTEAFKTSSLYQTSMMLEPSEIELEPVGKENMLEAEVSITLFNRENALFKVISAQPEAPLLQWIKFETSQDLHVEQLQASLSNPDINSVMKQAVAHLQAIRDGKPAKKVVGE